MDIESDDKTTWNKYTFYALGRYKSMCSILGIWPAENRATSGIRIGLFIILQMTTIGIFIERFIVRGNCGSIQEMIDTLVIGITSIQICIKCYLIFHHHNKFRNIVEFAINDWSKITNEQSRIIMLKNAYIGRILFIFQLFIGVATSVPVILSQLPSMNEIVNEADNSTVLFRTIPLALNCWISITMPSWLYYAYWTSVSAYGFTMGIATVSCNLLIFICALHIITQLKILYMNVENLWDNKNYTEQRKFLEKFIKRHNLVLKIANDFEDASNGVILCSFILIIAFGSFAGVIFILAMKAGQNSILGAMVLRLTLVLVQLYIYSLLGEKLQGAITSIQDAVYSGPWYKSPLICRDLQMIMVRSTYPYNLTAGKLCTMNLQTCRAAVQSMFSFFSVLRLMLFRN